MLILSQKLVQLWVPAAHCACKACMQDFLLLSWGHIAFKLLPRMSPFTAIILESALA